MFRRPSSRPTPRLPLLLLPLLLHLATATLREQALYTLLTNRKAVPRPNDATIESIIGNEDVAVRTSTTRGSFR